MVLIDLKKVILQLTWRKICYYDNNESNFSKLSYPIFECISDKTISIIANMSDLSWHKITKNSNYQGGKTTKQTK